MTVSLRCSSQLPCQGRFSINTKARVGKRHKLGTVVCSTASYKLRAHRQKSVRARISAACASLLRQARGQQINGQFTSRPRTGQLGIIKRVGLTL